MGKKAQMSAPFELMVAVIIMGFVILIGANLLDSMNRQVCLNTVDKSLSDFVALLEDTTNNRSSTGFHFSTQGCFQDKKTTIKIEKRNTSKECSLLCSTPSSNSCYGITFFAENVPNAYISKCINIPGYTTFMSMDTCNERRDDESYKWVDVYDNLQVGNYSLKNISTSGDTFPKICVYRKSA